MEQVKLWITEEGGSVSPLPIRERIEYEHLLEEMLVGRPDMLGDGVTLVGRQLMTSGGPLDLLGVDQDGKLVVFELKRGSMPRETLTQAIDYASWLDSLEFDELARRISSHQPVGVERDFDDFDDWYAEQFAEDQAQQLRPTRIVVVGLGIEPGAERMAHWLADKGVDIEAVTFHAFEHDARTVLARQVEVSSEDVAPSKNRSAQPRPDPLRRAAEFQAAEAYRSAHQLVASCFAGSPYAVHTFKNGVNFALPPADDRRIQRYPAYVGVFVRTESSGMINVVIRPAASASCPEESAKLRADAQRLGAQVGQSGNDPGRTIWIGVDVSHLEAIESCIVEFTRSAIAAWERSWNAWNAGDAQDDAVIDAAGPTLTSAPTSSLDRS